MNFFSYNFFSKENNLDDILQKESTTLEDILELQNVEEEMRFNQALPLFLLKNPKMIQKMIRYSLFPQDLQKEDPQIPQDKLKLFSYKSTYFFSMQPEFMADFFFGEEIPQLNEINDPEQTHLETKKDLIMENEDDIIQDDSQEESNDTTEEEQNKYMEKETNNINNINDDNEEIEQENQQIEQEDGEGESIYNLIEQSGKQDKNDQIQIEKEKQNIENQNENEEKIQQKYDIDLLKELGPQLMGEIFSVLDQDHIEEFIIGNFQKMILLFSEESVWEYLALSEQNQQIPNKLIKHIQYTSIQQILIDLMQFPLKNEQEKFLQEQTLTHLISNLSTISQNLCTYIQQFCDGANNNINENKDNNDNDIEDVLVQLEYQIENICNILIKLQQRPEPKKNPFNTEEIGQISQEQINHLDNHQQKIGQQLKSIFDMYFKFSTARNSQVQKNSNLISETLKNCEIYFLDLIKSIFQSWKYPSDQQFLKEYEDCLKEFQRILCEENTISQSKNSIQYLGQKRMIIIDIFQGIITQFYQQFQTYENQIHDSENHQETEFEKVFLKDIIQTLIIGNKFPIECIKLMQRYEWNNQLHLKIFSIFQIMINCNYEPLLRHMIQSSNSVLNYIINNILSDESNFETQVKCCAKKINKGYYSIILELLILFYEKSEHSGSLRFLGFFEKPNKWDEIKESLIEPKIELYKVYKLGDKVQNINRILSSPKNNNSNQKPSLKNIKKQFALFVILATVGGCEKENEGLCQNKYCRNNPNYGEMTKEKAAATAINLIKTGEIHNVQTCDQYIDGIKHQIGCSADKWYCKICKFGNENENSDCKRCDSERGEQKDQSNENTEKIEDLQHNNTDLNPFICENNQQQEVYNSNAYWKFNQFQYDIDLLLDDVE